MPHHNNHANKSNNTFDYKNCFYAALLSYFFIYGFEITHFTLSIDEEFKDNFTQTLMLGRWGHAILKHYILPEPYIPFFTSFVSIFALSISSVLSAFYLDLKRYQAIAFVIMLAALPQLAYQMEFANQADTISIAFVLSSLSLICMDKDGKWYWTSFVILTVIAVSIYQSIFLYSLSLLCVKLTLEAVRSNYGFKVTIPKFIKYSTATVLALIINSMISRVINIYLSVPHTNYLDNMIGWGNKPLIEIARSIYSIFIQYITFSANPGLNMFTIVLTWFLLILLSALFSKKNRISIVTHCIVTILSAFALNFLIGGWLSPRAMTQLPIVFAGMFIIAMVSFGLNKASLPISLIFLAVGGASSNTLFYNDYMARKSDDQLGRDIVTTIYNKYPSFDILSTPVFFYGSITPYNYYRAPYTDSFGASFFEWDGGNNRRIYAYMSISNIAKFVEPNENQINKASITGKSLPSWPNRDSVYLHDGVIIVKIGNTLSPLNR